MSAPTRQPAGTPSGGQFAATGRAEPRVQLRQDRARERVADEALHLAAKEVLEAHPTARSLLLHEDTTGPMPVVVAYTALVGGGDLLTLDPDTTDAVHGHLGALDGMAHARESAAMAGAPNGPHGVWLPLRQAVDPARAA